MKGKFIDLSTTYYPICLYLTQCEYSFYPNCLIATNDMLSAFGFDNKKREQRVRPKCQKIQTFENRIVPELWVCLHWPKIEKVMEKDYQCAQHDGYFTGELCAYHGGYSSGESSLGMAFSDMNINV